MDPKRSETLKKIRPYDETKESVARSKQMIKDDPYIFDLIADKLPPKLRKRGKKTLENFVNSEFKDVETQENFTGFFKNIFDYAFQNKWGLGSGLFWMITAGLKLFNQFGKMKPTGLSVFEDKKPYLVIFNHDEILDPLAIVYSIYQKTHELFYGVAGDNLHKFPFMEATLRGNRAFTIIRQDADSKNKAGTFFSEFTKQLLVEKKSLLIANNNGTCKEGKYECNGKLIQMLGYYLRKNNLDGNVFSHFNLVTCSISYDKTKHGFFKDRKFTKTNIYKAIVNYNNQHDNHDNKTNDDAWRFLYSMSNFSKCYMNFGQPLQLEQLDPFRNANIVEQKINESIMKNYTLTEDNYLAYDMLNNSIADTIHNHGKFDLGVILFNLESHLNRNFAEYQTPLVIETSFNTSNKKNMVKNYFKKKIKPLLEYFDKEFNELNMIKKDSNSLDKYKEQKMEIFKQFLNIYANPVILKKQYRQSGFKDVVNF